MATIKSNALLLSEIENALKKATEPMSVRDLESVVDISAAMTSPNQVRDGVKSLQERGIVTKHNMIDSKGDKRAKVGFMWASGNIPYPVTKKAATAPIKPIKPAPLVIGDTQKEFELIIHGVSIVITKNPINGRVRVVIE